MNCSMCKNFLNCDDPKKGPSYICNDYSAITVDPPVFSGSKNVASVVEKDENQTMEDVMDEAYSEEDNDAQVRLEALLDEAMHPQKIIPPDLKIDDRDLPEASNFYSFCLDPHFLNETLLPKQMIIFTHLLGEWCPFCSSEIAQSPEEFPVDYPVHNAKEDISFLEYGICPSCGRGQAEMIKEGYLRSYQELAMCIGQRSGKTIGLSLFQSYLLHRFLKLQNPGKVYNQTSNTFFSATMVGISFNRAKTLLYNPLRNLVESKRWFIDYHAMLDDYSNQYGEELYRVGREVMNYRHRNIVLYPSSPSKRALRGDTRIWTSCDEIGWFPFGEDSNKLERAGADEVYEALDRSLLTVRIEVEDLIDRGFNNVLMAYGLYSSSPSAHNDKIMSLMRAFRGSSTGLSIHLPSWEMNPKIKRESKSIIKEYAVNAIKAERDYGAIPPLADSAFIDDINIYMDCFTDKPNIISNYKYKNIIRAGSERRSIRFKDELRRMKGPAVMAIDSGVSNNSFAVAIGRIRKNVPQVTGILEISPESENVLDHTEIFDECIVPIIDYNVVCKVLVDRWQSIKITHDIEKYGESIGRTIIGEQYTMRRDDFEYVLDNMKDPNTMPRLPNPEMDMEKIKSRSVVNYPKCFRYQPISHLLFQMLTVREGTKNIEKGQGYTDDLFRALFLLLTFLYDEEERHWLFQQDEGGFRRAAVVGTSRVYSRMPIFTGASFASSSIGSRARLMGPRS